MTATDTATPTNDTATANDTTVNATANNTTANATTTAKPASDTATTATNAATAQGAHRTAIIDVGGGFRAIFGAGVLDRCSADGITFDHGYGVSAGAANLTSFIARQPGRNHTFYTQYAFRKEYASTESFFKNHNFANLDYIYGTLSNHDGENPVDFAAFEENPMGFTVVACNAEDGSTKYFDKSRIRFDDFDAVKASSAVPVACEPYVVDGVPYYDGGIADPVPVQKALDDGYDRVVVVLTRLRDVLREQKKDLGPARILQHRYPAAAERLRERYRTYNDEVALAKEYEKDGRVLILAPDDLCGLSTLSKTFEGLEMMYRKGYAAAGAIADFLAD
ncbi:patatin-like phospholipase family protein [Bifidobacterium leontopitheci]|uniref:Patatin family protein n=1 Tax=Bifidobacterium leontopitheci TaxID=2650774 RepID=A0A6I1GEE6_9BIFI|nr:patatin family protein [Bifidobacterium leontopitheci]KAB7790004.1 patatin family protein [Bifidobacterium leontopitheci]